MKIGDKVSFLSDTGGGVIAGFKGKNIVLVEDADGFQIPTPINDVVLVSSGDAYSTSGVVSGKQSASSPASEGKSIKAMMTAQDEEMDEDWATPDEVDLKKEVTFKAPAEERKGGNRLSCYLAFVPVNIKEMTSTRFEVYIVNDCNYSIHYSYMVAEGAAWTLHAYGEVEPNTQLYIEEIGRETLNDLLRIGFQLMAYKTDKPFTLKPMVEAQFRLDPVKFYKLHTFRDTPYFETPALLYTIVENDQPVRPLTVDAKQLKSDMYKPAEPEKADRPEADTYVRRHDKGGKGNPLVVKRRGDEDVAVVDLHADVLLDTTAGMSHADILNYQMGKFHEALDRYKNKKGQKIVFIHGKGEGILRHSIIHALNYKYKKYQYQDASFQEYGYGATQVTIR